jgi:hypothetical protein
MTDLRGRCRARAKVLFSSKFDSSSMFICADRGDRCGSSDEAFITKRLNQTLTQLKSILTEMRFNFSSKAQIEEHLVAY